jgi:hypothetical protein
VYRKKPCKQTSTNQKGTKRVQDPRLWPNNRSGPSIKGTRSRTPSPPRSRVSTTPSEVPPRSRVSAPLEQSSASLEAAPRPTVSRSSILPDKSVKCPDSLRDATQKANFLPCRAADTAWGSACLTPSLCGRTPALCGHPQHCASTVRPCADMPTSLRDIVLPTHVLLLRRAPRMGMGATSKDVRTTTNRGRRSTLRHR